MKRWTLLVIPHDTDEPRSIAVSLRGLRWMGAGVVVVALAAIVGVGVTASWVARSGRDSAARLASDGEVSGAGATTEMDSLRATVRALNGALDTIRRADARLSEAAGVPVPDSAAMQAHAALSGSRASADSLLRRASLVAGRIGALADSASAREGGRRGVPTARGPVVRRDAPSQR